jgi:hypothetical protein
MKGTSKSLLLFLRGSILSLIHHCYTKPLGESTKGYMGCFVSVGVRMSENGAST